MSRYEKQSARVAPAPLPLDDEVQHAIDEVMRGRPALVLFTTLARDRRLFEKFFCAGLLDRGHLTLRQREIVIDRVTAVCSAEYEWGVHVATFAERAGLDHAALRSLFDGHLTDSRWTADERALIAASDSLLERCDLSDDTWEELTRHFSAEAAIEIVMLVGYYRTVSCLVRSLRLPLEPDAARFADVES